MGRSLEPISAAYARGRVHLWMSWQLIAGPYWAFWGFGTLLKGKLAFKISWQQNDSPTYQLTSGLHSIANISGSNSWLALSTLQFFSLLASGHTCYPLHSFHYHLSPSGCWYFTSSSIVYLTSVLFSKIWLLACSLSSIIFSIVITVMEIMMVEVSILDTSCPTGLSLFVLW